MNPIYLDYNATTPLDPAVVEAMLPYLRDHFGNPSSTHAFGRTAHEAVEKARKQVAEFIGAQPEEIIFTGGGTEASNHALKGAVFAKLHGLFGRWAKDAHIITSAIEHSSVRGICDALEQRGWEVTRLPVYEEGDGGAPGDLVANNARLHAFAGDLVPLRDGLRRTVLAEAHA